MSKNLLLVIFLTFVGFLFFVCTNEKDMNLNKNKDKLNQEKQLKDINNKNIEISFVVDSFSCSQKNIHSKFDVMIDGNYANSIKVKNCESNKGEVLKQNKNFVYFSIPPGGMGGYILYGKYNNLYKLNLNTNSIEKILELDNISDLAFNSDLSSVAFSDTSESKIIIKNIANKQELFFNLNLPPDAQFGDFKFSPDNKKVAFAVGYGPDNERGEIHFLNVEDESIFLYEKTKNPPSIISWIDNETLNWE